MSAALHPTPGELRTISHFADLPEDQLAWFAERSEVREFGVGDVVFHEGAPADTMFLVLEGEVHGRPENAPPDGRVYITVAGDVAGILPFSRMTHWGGTGRVVQPARLVFFAATLFPEMLRRIPALEPHLVQLMADRVRENTRMDQQREKLLALGRLSAGLAHELNNPAAAARRAAAGLGEALRDVRTRTAPLAACLGAAPLEPLAACVDGLRLTAGESPLARSDAVTARSRSRIGWSITAYRMHGPGRLPLPSPAPTFCGWTSWRRRSPAPPLCPRSGGRRRRCALVSCSRWCKEVRRASPSW